MQPHPATESRSIHRFVKLRLEALALLSLVLTATNALAIAPPYLSDEELTRFPILVLAKWPKSELQHHKLVHGNELKKYEAFTELEVIRVIKGRIQPGKHRLMLNQGVVWQQDGSQLRTGTSTDLPGDVENVAEPSLWFLDQASSWDSADHTLYYHLPNYRAIQPRSLEAYFAALASRTLHETAPKLLTSSDSETVHRVLKYIAGGALPWPYHDEWASPSGSRVRGARLKKHAAAVRKLLEHETPETRRLAASVYAALAGADSVSEMRRLLVDTDPEVRGIATGILAQHEDESSTVAMREAVQGLREPHLACKVVQKLAAWARPEIVPVLAAFLETDTCWGYSNDYLGSPAIQARSAINKITSCWFPFDVKQSLEAWDRTSEIALPEQRRQKLRLLLPFDSCPIEATLAGTVDEAFVTVTNGSTHAVAITRYPAWVNVTTKSASGSAETGYKRPSSESDFVLLLPGESTRFQLSWTDFWRAVQWEQMRIELVYRELGRTYGLPGWIGRVQVNRAPTTQAEPSGE